MTPLNTIGVVAKFPKAPLPGILKLHFFFSEATFAAEMSVLVVARELERSKLWAGHAPPLAATSGGSAPAEEAASDVTASIEPRAATASERALNSRHRWAGMTIPLVTNQWVGT